MIKCHGCHDGWIPLGEYHVKEEDRDLRLRIDRRCPECKGSGVLPESIPEAKPAEAPAPAEKQCSMCGGTKVIKYGSADHPAEDPCPLCTGKACEAE